MIAVDTNILVYSHRTDSGWHEAAEACVSSLAQSSMAWAIPWPCIHEFLAITTHPRIFDPPSPVADALEQVECWREAPGLALIGEDRGYWNSLRRLIEPGQIQGGRIHDARIAAICLQHGVTELWSADRDFSRFPALRVINPLVRQRS
jgi:toxin-antitoxin system PIN domain toxin